MIFDKLRFRKQASQLSDDPDQGRKRPYIDFFTEYGTGPIWLCREEDDFRQPVEASSLPISKGLAKDIDAWQYQYDEPLRIPNYDWSHQEPKIDLGRDFWERGQQLVDRLKQELGSDYDIQYSPHEPRTVELEGARITDMNTFYDEVQKKVFPAWKDFGRNLDALYDALSSVERKMVIWSKSEKNRKALGDEQFKKIVEIFKESEMSLTLK